MHIIGYHLDGAPYEFVSLEDILNKSEPNMDVQPGYNMFISSTSIQLLVYSYFLPSSSPTCPTYKAVINSMSWTPFSYSGDCNLYFFIVIQHDGFIIPAFLGSPVSIHSKTLIGK